MLLVATAGLVWRTPLPALLAPLANHRLNMTRIESRPAPDRKWQYVFFIDVDGHADEEPLASALAQMDALGGKSVLLGSYPRAVRARQPDRGEEPS